jgi:hypothetical protein
MKCFLEQDEAEELSIVGFFSLCPDRNNKKNNC